MWVYLCGPINGCSDSEANDWRLQVKYMGFNSIDPMRRDYRGTEQENYREIIDLDKKDIRFCDVVVARFVKPSVGTSMEILYAWEHEKYIIVWADPETIISPWLRYHSSCIVTSGMALEQKLREYR